MAATSSAQSTVAPHDLLFRTSGVWKLFLGVPAFFIVCGLFAALALLFGLQLKPYHDALKPHPALLQEFNIRVAIAAASISGVITLLGLLGGVAGGVVTGVEIRRSGVRLRRFLRFSRKLSWSQVRLGFQAQELTWYLGGGVGNGKINWKEEGRAIVVYRKHSGDDYHKFPIWDFQETELIEAIRRAEPTIEIEVLKNQRRVSARRDLRARFLELDESELAAEKQARLSTSGESASPKPTYGRLLMLASFGCHLLSLVLLGGGIYVWYFHGAEVAAWYQQAQIGDRFSEAWNSGRDAMIQFLVPPLPEAN